MPIQHLPAIASRIIRSLSPSQTQNTPHPPLKPHPDGFPIYTKPGATNGAFSTVIADVEYEWDVQTLYQHAAALNLPSSRFTIPTSFLHQWYWGDSSIEEHVQRTLHADYEYPILVWDGQIIDGTHRCCLSLACGMQNIKAIHIVNMPPPSRSYTPNPFHNPPLNNPLKTHLHVIHKVHALMFDK